MAAGRVKWFDEKKGYGFILMEGQKDIFVHRSAIKGELLKEGDEVEFEIAQGHKGPEAVNVKVVG